MKDSHFLLISCSFLMFSHPSASVSVSILWYRESEKRPPPKHELVVVVVVMRHGTGKGTEPTVKTAEYQCLFCSLELPSWEAQLLA